MLQWVPYGPHALLLRFADHVGDDAYRLGRAMFAELERHPPHGLLECVPGFTTVLLTFDPDHCDNLSLTGQHLSMQLSDLSPKDFTEPTPIKIHVRYNGEDLESLAEEKQLSPRELIALHKAPTYKVYLLGFSPGFPYLGELDPRLHTPRRTSPRTHVAAGSVAIGGEHTGIYSVDSPGGWHIIGHAAEPIFHPERLTAARDINDAFVLKAGDRVKFVPAKK